MTTPTSTAATITDLASVINDAVDHELEAAQARLDQAQAEQAALGNLRPEKLYYTAAIYDPWDSDARSDRDVCSCQHTARGLETAVQGVEAEYRRRSGHDPRTDQVLYYTITVELSEGAKVKIPAELWTAFSIQTVDTISQRAW